MSLHIWGWAESFNNIDVLLFVLTSADVRDLFMSSRCARCNTMRYPTQVERARAGSALLALGYSQQITMARCHWYIQVVTLLYKLLTETIPIYVQPSFVQTVFASGHIVQNNVDDCVELVHVLGLADFHETAWHNVVADGLHELARQTCILFTDCCVSVLGFFVVGPMSVASKSCSIILIIVWIMSAVVHGTVIANMT